MNNDQQEPFKREDRYIVIKRKDLDRLSPIDRDVVVSNLEHISAILFGWNVPDRECLVIESDWPEYAQAWASIEERVTGQPAAQHQGEPVAWATDREIQALRGGNIASMYPNEVLTKIPLYAHADTGEIERLRQEVDRLKGGGQLLVQDRNDLRAKVVERDAMLKGWLSMSPSNFMSMIEGTKAILSASAEPSAQVAQYPNRLCHIDYTAHPYKCGCLKGDEESQRIYDEHCRAGSAEPSAPKCRKCGDTGVIEDKGKDELPGGEFVERGLVSCPGCEDQGAPVEIDERASIKLVDILANDLEKWPAECDEVFQTSSGRIIGVRHGDDLFSIKVGTYTLNTEGNDPHVSHGQWLKARAALERNHG